MNAHRYASHFDLYQQTPCRLPMPSLTKSRPAVPTKSPAPEQPAASTRFSGRVSTPPTCPRREAGVSWKFHSAVRETVLRGMSARLPDSVACYRRPCARSGCSKKVWRRFSADACQCTIGVDLVSACWIQRRAAQPAAGGPRHGRWRRRSGRRGQVPRSWRGQTCAMNEAGRGRSRSQQSVGLKPSRNILLVNLPHNVAT